MWSTRDSDCWWQMGLVLAAGMGLGWFLFEGVPMLWDWAKRLIYAVTG